MTNVSYALFDSPLGRYGVAWSEQGLRHLLLPEKNIRATEQRLKELTQGEKHTSPPSFAREAVRRVDQILRGESPSSLADLPLDWSGRSEFDKGIWESLKRLPLGSLATYQDLARLIGKEKGARAVGQSVGRNPLPILIPCHRIMAQSGWGGFSAFGGLETKRKLLLLEGAPLGLMKDENLRRSMLRHVDRAHSGFAALRKKMGDFSLVLQQKSSLFAFLLSSITSQQLSPKAAATIETRLRALFPDPKDPTPEALLALPVTSIRAAGLSQAKTLALRDLAEKTLSHDLPTRAEAAWMDDETLIEKLSSVRGIGRWTAEMCLIFYLGRPDVWSFGDYALKKNLSQIQKRSRLPTEREFLAFGRAFRPYRSVMSWYLWKLGDK